MKIHIKELNEMWATDCKMNEDRLDSESLRTPNLHSKYLEILSALKIKIEYLKAKYKILRQKRFRWYRGELPKCELEAQKWEQYQGIKPLKTEMDELLEGDQIIVDSLADIDYHKIMIEFCESVMKQIHQRDFQIKNAITWSQFVSGR